MAQIATSIFQSKKLLELGIDPKTADMYYYCQSEYDLRIGGYKAVDKELDVPAWSLTALLELMPEIEYNLPALIKKRVTDGGIGYFIVYADTVRYGKPKPHTTKLYEKPINAAVEMIEWLVNNGYIKKVK